MVGTFGDMKCTEMGQDSVPLCWAFMHKLLVSSELQFSCLQTSSKDIHPGLPCLNMMLGRKGSGKRMY